MCTHEEWLKLGQKSRPRAVGEGTSGAELGLPQDAVVLALGPAERLESVGRVASPLLANGIVVEFLDLVPLREPFGELGGVLRGQLELRQASRTV